jgi:predicted GTPase
LEIDVVQAGQALIDLCEAFQEALINFFPNESRKTALKKIMEKSKELEQMQSNELMQQIDEAVTQVIPTIQAETRRKVQESLSNALSGNMPESLESIPPHLVSGS